MAKGCKLKGANTSSEKENSLNLIVPLSRWNVALGIL